ncbi:hypothetical protein PHYSODRAFT_530107 [Phytophthora sojae]|uniref:PH domain-containing protein n=1 Tax=Phytophthora sojae (strain P6497) TaxID=1094619 RepID=G5ACA1_PHYSP|nr:hypothetical protein PHYSODRAFT_530107 [Phytophthora sojae]EGZ06975.1 hypothetical protein PHYSODRAFT_530107 [Phytophthora sojae]|eukprot:XP_009537739.1 hypothetical protein PHYSODRAFT_530107 [Phytophthora sojae]
MLVNGVDISMLEGWMIKINSNPSFFGKNMNRRWFKVGFVPGPGSEKKLVISYSTSKTAKDPRGWLYVEDVSGIYCRRVSLNCIREMIEIVSPSRTLRLKGETAVEHRLWSDSLYKLCNPPPKSATAVVQTTPAVAEPRQERTPRRSQRETKQADEKEAEDRAQRKQRQRSDRDRERERERDRRPVEDDDRERGKTTTTIAIVTHGSAALRRPSSAPNQDENNPSNRPSEYEHSDDDSSEDDRADSPRPSTNSSTRSLLVAQIKSGSSFEGDIGAQCKNVISDSEEEEEDDAYHYEKKEEDPEGDESPREPVTTSTNALDEDTSRDELEQMNPERIPAAKPPSKRVTSDYFDSDEEDNDQPAPPPAKNAAARDDPKAPVSSVAADNNFVHDDWDAEEEEPTSSAPASKSSYPAAVGSGGVAADANFVHDDWDD